jgi:hypothetical protein
MHPVNGLFEFFKRQVTLATRGKQLVGSVESLVDECCLGKFDGASARSVFIMLDRLSAAAN